MNTKIRMPKTKGESIFFTAITAWMMVYVMTLYNTVLASGSFTNATFFTALKGMWIEYIIIALLAYFVSGHLAKFYAFKIVQPGDRPIFIILSIQIFTVIWQVTFASVLGVYHAYGFTANFISDYLITYCKNFIMALPLQLIIVGPLARLIFRTCMDIHPLSRSARSGSQHPVDAGFEPTEAEWRPEHELQGAR